MADLPGDVPRTGSRGGRSLHQAPPHYAALAGTDGVMAREPHLRFLPQLATPLPERRRAERLSLRTAVFWIGILSLGCWALIIALILALD
jgi:hypothetical protein